MQIKTSDGGTSNVASQGLGVWGAVGGGLGTLALLNQGFLGGSGILGNRHNGCGCHQDNDTRQISALESKIAKLESERYTDSVGIDLYKEIVAKSNAEDEKIQSNYNELARAIAALDKQVAVDKQATVDNFAFLNNKIDTTKQEVLCYVNATFVPGKLVMPLSSICPEAMQRYNSWTAPTTPAPTEATGA